MNWNEEIKKLIPKKDKRLIYIDEIGNKIRDELKENDINLSVNVHYPEKKVVLLIDYYYYEFTLTDVLRLELNKQMDTEEAVRYIIKEKIIKRFNFKDELFSNIKFK